jgi:regulatory protein
VDNRKARLLLQNYCAKGERCHFDIRQKLRDWQIARDDADELIAELISDNFLNEQRYANAFAHDKFYLQQWGRGKITQHLQQKQVSAACIAEALSRINADDYRQTAHELAQRKAKQLGKEQLPPTRRQKIANFLLQRGFEPDIAWEAAKEQSSREK